MNPKTPEEPQAGGSYERNPDDGTLTLRHRTEPALPRERRDGGSAATPATAEAPAPTSGPVIPAQE